MQNIQEIRERIANAQMLLVGIGEELDLYRSVERSGEYQRMREKVKNQELLPFLVSVMVEQQYSERNAFYEELEECLGQKNYFIVSVCRDDAIAHSGLDMGRVVTPCGGFRMLQCPDACDNELYPFEEAAPELKEELRRYLKGEITEEEIHLPSCPHCGRTLVFNSVKADHYVEAGYLTQWALYTKWLQGTLNRELCVLELGVGMSYPTVIRWPFEKTVFINQKAYLYRVHSSLYQITEEVAGKAEGICAQPTEFLKELSNGK